MTVSTTSPANIPLNIPAELLWENLKVENALHRVVTIVWIGARSDPRHAAEADVLVDAFPIYLHTFTPVSGDVKAQWMGYVIQPAVPDCLVLLCGVAPLIGKVDGLIRVPFIEPIRALRIGEVQMKGRVNVVVNGRNITEAQFATKELFDAESRLDRAVTSKRPSDRRDFSIEDCSWPDTEKSVKPELALFSIAILVHGSAGCSLRGGGGEIVVVVDGVEGDLWVPYENTEPLGSTAMQNEVVGHDTEVRAESPFTSMRFDQVPSLSDRAPPLRVDRHAKRGGGGWTGTGIQMS